MNINWQTISKETFLTEYWQKKPIVLKNAITQFNDPIDVNELAGLAMEEFIDSRIVKQNNGSWNVEHGPFSDFEQLPQSHWTLLVQSVDRWFDEVNELKSLVSFLPQWQVDDVMISYSEKGGSVGAHLDQYNVFIVQGQGQRRWQAGAVDKQLTQFEATQDLLLVDDFEPIVDDVLNAGDIIYIPPFSPHKGETIEAALNYSIGFRAPNQQELLTSFADFVIENNHGNERFVSEATKTVKTIDQQIEDLHEFMQTLTTDKQLFSRYAHQLLTTPTRLLDIAEVEQAITDEELVVLINNNDVTLNKVRCLDTSVTCIDGQHWLYCAGEEFQLTQEQLLFAKELVAKSTLYQSELNSFFNCLENKQLVTKLINLGYWYVD